MSARVLTNEEYVKLAAKVGADPNHHRLFDTRSLTPEEQEKVSEYINARCKS